MVLPTYNERDNLERVVADVRAYGCDVLVVDDCSPDGTGEIADRLAQADAGVSVLHRPHKLGLGSAYVQGFRRGLGDGYGLFLEMDADGSHLAEYLPALIADVQRHGGLALGSRYVPGGSIVGWGFLRYSLSWGANVYCRLVLGIRVKDCTSGYRCYSRDLLEKIGLQSIVSQGYSFQIEMLLRCVQLGYPVTEVPIRFEDRIAGKSKVSEGEIRRALLNVVRMRFQRQAKPGRVQQHPEGIEA